MSPSPAITLPVHAEPTSAARRVLPIFHRTRGIVGVESVTCPPTALVVFTVAQCPRGVVHGPNLCPSLPTTGTLSALQLCYFLISPPFIECRNAAAARVLTLTQRAESLAAIPGAARHWILRLSPRRIAAHNPPLTLQIITESLLKIALADLTQAPAVRVFFSFKACNWRLAHHYFVSAGCEIFQIRPVLLILLPQAIGRVYIDGEEDQYQYAHTELNESSHFRGTISSSLRSICIRLRPGIRNGWIRIAGIPVLAHGSCGFGYGFGFPQPVQNREPDPQTRGSARALGISSATL
ncbi:hypothetical protein B0H14DRAFT_2580067 [Mycena olivaceomarginata]|nr:hypothetical protein B0H14DRAFT_2580067 [Mycena olivaceomarginata]